MSHQRDDFRPAARVDIPRRPRLGLKCAGEAGLFLDLAQRAVLVAFAVLRLALRERPVVVLRPVHEEHRAVPDDEPARGADDGHFAARSSARQAFGQAARAAARLTCSRAISRPATTA